MKLSELIEALTALQDESDGEIEVVVAHQQNYPLMEAIDTITLLQNFDARDKRTLRGDGKQNVVFIACGSGNDYAPSAAWEGDVIDCDEIDEEQT